MQLTIKNGKPHFKVRVSIEGNLDEKPGIIDQIEKELSRQAEKSYNTLFAELQQKGSDIFGFGEYVRAKAPSFWNRHIKTSEAWHEMYKEITVEFEPSIKVRRVGMKNL